METVLLIVTVLSLVVAMAMSVVTWRVARDEKRRAAARVAALSAAAFGSAAVLHGDACDVVPYPPQAPPIPIGASDGVPHMSQGLELNAPGVASQEAEGTRQTAEGRTILGSTGHGQSSGGRQRALAAAAAVLFMGLAGTLVWTFAQPRAGVAAGAQASAPLELLSLTHERQASKLAVSGLVRNPVAAQSIARLSVVVFLFDRNGTLVGNGRAPVDFTMLGAGDESPFVVSVDAPATVARYRVSFRTDDGLVPHVDRRTAPPAAAAAEQPVSVAVK